MGLQWISAESKHRHMSHKSAAFLLRRSAALLCVRWHLAKNKWRLPIDTRRCPHHTDKKAAKGEGFSESFLIILQKNNQHKCQPFTIPTFQTLNVRFSVKIFEKNFEPTQKNNGFTIRINGIEKAPERCKSGALATYKLQCLFTYSH